MKLRAQNIGTHNALTVKCSLCCPSAVVSPQKYVLKNVTLPCLVFDPVGTGSTVMDFNGTSFEPATLVSACSRPQDFLFW